MAPRTQAADSTHAMKYRKPNEDFRESCNRRAFALADDGTHYHEFREIIQEQRFCEGGRIQGSAGAARKTTMHNCYVLPAIDDTLGDSPNSIMDVLKMAAMTSRSGGGVGYDFSTIRPYGDRVHKIDSYATGPVSFMEYFNTMGLGISSAGHRRGAQMAVLRIDHPDIDCFIRAKHGTPEQEAIRRAALALPPAQRAEVERALQAFNKLTGFNISVGVTDEFMEALAAKRTFPLRFGGRVFREVDAEELWESIMRATYDWAEPGTIFLDTINRMNPLWYCETIATTNPCFTGDTMVWTSDGEKSFAELARLGMDVLVLTKLRNGKLAYRPMKQPRLTKYHADLVKVVLRGSGRKAGSVTSIRCTPEHEFFLSNGKKKQAQNLRSGDSIVSVYRAKANQKGYMRVSTHGDSVMEHYLGAEAAYGRIASTHNSEHMRGDLNPMRRFPEKNHFLKKDFSGSNNGMFGRRHSEETRSKIGKKTAERFKNPIFRNKHLEACLNHTVVSIEKLDHKEPVYCGTVPSTGRFFTSLKGHSEGVLVSNCGEQPLPPHSSCLLGSFNLVQYLRTIPSEQQTTAKYDFDYDLLAHDIPIVVRAMDNVVDRSIYPLEAQREESLKKRRMGLGVMGLANAGEALGHPYGSPTFLEFTKTVLAFIERGCYQASAEIAAVKGPFPLFEADRYLAGPFITKMDSEVKDLIRKNGIRNSHLTSIAPTGTISLCADNVSSGVEPVLFHRAKRPISAPNERIETVVEDYGVAFLGTRGKLADEVTADEHVAVLLAAQEHIDSAVSKTINMDGKKMEWADFKNIYRKVYEGGGKGCTTYNRSGSRAALITDANDEALCTIDPEGRRDCS